MTIQSNSPSPRFALVARELAEYGVARLRDEVFEAVLSLWHRRKYEGWTQKQVADIIGRDPAWVSRTLRAPGNWTLRTAGELIQGLNGEAEIRISALEDAPDILRNYDAYEGYIPDGNAQNFIVGGHIASPAAPGQVTIGGTHNFQAEIRAAR